MAVTKKEILGHLDAVGANVLKDITQNDVEVIQFEKYNNTLSDKTHYTILLTEDGGMFQLINSFGNVENFGDINQSALMGSLLHHNFQTKFGTWDLDLKDNHIKHTVEIPLEDNTLTEKQFKRIIDLSEFAVIEFIKIVGTLKLSNNDSDGI